MADSDIDLIRKWIKPDPRQPGVVGVRAGYDLHVWAVVGQLDPEQDDPIGALAAKHDVPREAIDAALIWFSRYPEPLIAHAAAWSGATLAQMDADLERVRSRVAAAITRSRAVRP